MLDTELAKPILFVRDLLVVACGVSPSVAASVYKKKNWQRREQRLTLECGLRTVGDMPLDATIEIA